MLQEISNMLNLPNDYEDFSGDIDLTASGTFRETIESIENNATLSTTKML
ncbi:MAG: hypothetical protein K2P17_03880 [Helicobacteraceae bacterium]|nr:hypothetical protein [Helicobacteraceae bacterium]